MQTICDKKQSQTMYMRELVVLIKPIMKQIGNAEIQDRFLYQQKEKIQD